MYCELISFVLGELWLMIRKILTHNSSLLFILSYWNVVWSQLLLSSTQKSRFILLPWLNQPNDQITFVMVFPSFCSMSCLSFRHQAELCSLLKVPLHWICPTFCLVEVAVTCLYVILWCKSYHSILPQGDSRALSIMTSQTQNGCDSTCLLYCLILIILCLWRHCR